MHSNWKHTTLIPLTLLLGFNSQDILSLLHSIESFNPNRSAQQSPVSGQHHSGLLKLPLPASNNAPGKTLVRSQSDHIDYLLAQLSASTQAERYFPDPYEPAQDYQPLNGSSSTSTPATSTSVASLSFVRKSVTPPEPYQSHHIQNKKSRNLETNHQSEKDIENAAVS
jgi:hypothetical protein